VEGANFDASLKEGDELVIFIPKAGKDICVFRWRLGETTGPASAGLQGDATQTMRKTQTEAPGKAAETGGKPVRGTKTDAGVKRSDKGAPPQTETKSVDTGGWQLMTRWDTSLCWVEAPQDEPAQAPVPLLDSEAANLFEAEGEEIDGPLEAAAELQMDEAQRLQSKASEAPGSRAGTKDLAGSRPSLNGVEGGSESRAESKIDESRLMSKIDIAAEGFKEVDSTDVHAPPQGPILMATEAQPVPAPDGGLYVFFELAGRVLEIEMLPVDHGVPLELLPVPEEVADDGDGV
jgi:hypothetical protein